MVFVAAHKLLTRNSHKQLLLTTINQLFRKGHGYCTESSEGFAPLDGVRVLDVTRVLAGPYCTMILGDLGAEVIKIERPGIGDDTRSWGPPWMNDESAYFLSINRNKKSVCVDLKTEKGSSIIKELASVSDVFIENYVPGKLQQYGLSYEHLLAVNPTIVYASITGFGPAGPYAHRGGYDLIASAVGGLMGITGPEDGDPCRVGVAMTDLHTGMYAVSSILASLLHRNERRKGSHINCNLLNTQVAGLTHIAANWLNKGVVSKRYGTGHPSIVPYQAFKTSDGGHFIIGAGNNKQFQKLCEILHLPDLPSDPRFTSNSNRVQHRHELVKILEAKFSKKTRDEWVAFFESTKAEFPYGPVNSIEETFKDPQVLHNRLIQEMDHPTAGKIKVVGPPVQYSGERLPLQNPPPTLGEHTEQVLSSLLNLDLSEINQLRKQKIIQ